MIVFSQLFMFCKPKVLEQSNNKEND
jgi:hypothetical protein